MNSTVHRTGALFFLLVHNQGRTVLHITIVDICAVNIRLPGDSVRKRHTVTRRTSKGYTQMLHMWFQNTTGFVVYGKGITFCVKDGAPLFRASHGPPTCQFVRTSRAPFVQCT